MNWLLLCLSVLLSTGRNLLSKNISAVPFGKKPFFRLQAVIFLAGAGILLIFGAKDLSSVAPLTVGYGLIYGVLLITAQWGYTAALNSGNTSVCATLYSLGFIFPTLSGMIFWEEPFSGFKLLGVLCVLPAVILSGTGKTSGKNTEKRGYAVPLILAMTASGGLGIMQKVQQASPYPEQRTVFVLIAFGAAGILSLLFAGFTKKGEGLSPKKTGAAAGVGSCFAVCNLLNTFLAGRMDSAVFFPCLNIGMILLSAALSILLFKEKLTKKHLLILGLGFSAILLINLPL